MKTSKSISGVLLLDAIACQAYQQSNDPSIYICNDNVIEFMASLNSQGVHQLEIPDQLHLMLDDQEEAIFNVLHKLKLAECALGIPRLTDAGEQVLYGNDITLSVSFRPKEHTFPREMWTNLACAYAQEYMEIPGKPKEHMKNLLNFLNIQRKRSQRKETSFFISEDGYYEPSGNTEGWYTNTPGDVFTLLQEFGLLQIQDTATESKKEVSSTFIAAGVFSHTINPVHLSLNW